jgi:hypothetical protein
MAGFLTPVTTTEIPTTEAPTTAEVPTTPAYHFELGGNTYLNNTVVLVGDIGEGDDALLCVTDNRDCCDTGREGDFRFPNRSLVPTSSAGQDFYQTRGSQFIRLNRRNGVVSPVGTYGCGLPDANGMISVILIRIGKFLLSVTLQTCMWYMYTPNSY